MSRTRFPAAAFGLVLFACSLVAHGQVSQVADLNTGQNVVVQGSMFGSSAVRFAGRTLFVARTDRTGSELWETDGTPQGTRLAFDLCPGRCDGLPFNASLQLVDGLLFFSASDGVHGFEPWVWEAGDPAPRMLVDLNPGAPNSSPRLISSLSFLLGGLPVQRNYLSAERADVGRELWRLTVADTVSITLERDLAAGPVSSSPSSVEVIRNGTLLQSAVIGVLARLPGRGQELYGLNHSNAFAPPSSQFLYDLFQSSPQRSVLSPLVRLGSSVFVVVQDSTREASAPDRQELWVTQGSIGNTQQLTTGNRLDRLTAHAQLQRVFYSIRRSVSGSSTTQLGISDGTVAGTSVSANSGAPENLTVLGPRLVYTLETPSSGQLELRAAVGASASTEVVRVLAPAGSTNLFRAFAVPNLQRTRLFVGLNDRLWSSDGTVAGTQQIERLNPGFDSGRFTAIAPLSGTDLVFGWGPEEFSDGEPHFSNGSFGSAVALGNLAGDIGDSDVAPFAKIGSRLLFEAYRGTGLNQSTYALETASGAVEALPARASIALGQHFGRQWLAEDFNRLVQTDGTPAGTFTLANLQIAALDADCIIERGGLRYFVATPSGSSDLEIWRSDGSAAGSFPVTDFSDPSMSILPGVRECRRFGETNIARLGNDVVFVASTPATGAELHRLDASDQSSLVVDLRSGPVGSGIVALLALPNRVIFAADDGVFGYEVWASDGTAQGTQRLTDINPGPGDALEVNTFGPFVRAGSRAYFPAFDPTRGREMYVTDGTAAGTRRVTDLVTGPGSAFAGNFLGSGGGGRSGALTGGRVAVAVGEELVFGAAASTDCVLFRTQGNGSSAGCAYDPTLARFGPVREVVATPGGIVVFSAARLDRTQGEEIHALLNGQLLELEGADIAPGSQSSAPQNLFVDGETVYFQADDGSTGRELWRLALDNLGRVFADGFEAP